MKHVENKRVERYYSETEMDNSLRFAMVCTALFIAVIAGIVAVIAVNNAWKYLWLLMPVVGAWIIDNFIYWILGGKNNDRT